MPAMSSPITCVFSFVTFDVFIKSSRVTESVAVQSLMEDDACGTLA